MQITKAAAFVLANDLEAARTRELVIPVTLEAKTSA